MLHTPHVPLTHHYIFCLCTPIKCSICSYLCTAFLRDIHHVYMRGPRRTEDTRARSNTFTIVFPQLPPIDVGSRDSTLLIAARTAGDNPMAGRNQCTEKNTVNDLS